MARKTTSAAPRRTVSKKRKAPDKPKVVVSSKETEIKKPDTKAKEASPLVQGRLYEKNKKIIQSAIRDNIQAERILSEIQKCDEELTAISREIKLLNTIKSESRTKQISDQYKKDFVLRKNSVRVNVIRTKVEVNFKLLNKVLPDLKSVELSDPNGDNPFSSFTDAVRQLTQDMTLGLDGSDDDTE